MSTLTRDALRASPAADRLAWPFDFNLDTGGEAVPDWVAAVSGAALSLVATDGTGSSFVCHGDASDGNSPIVFAGSEGQWGVVGANLAEAVRVIVALPYWQDLATVKGGGIDAMRERVALVDAELRADEPDLDYQRAAILAELGLEPLADPVATLHQAVSTSPSELAIQNQDGDPFEPLWRG